MKSTKETWTMWKILFLFPKITVSIYVYSIIGVLRPPLRMWHILENEEPSVALTVRHLETTAADKGQNRDARGRDQLEAF